MIEKILIGISGVLLVCLIASSLSLVSKDKTISKLKSEIQQIELDNITKLAKAQAETLKAQQQIQKSTEAIRKETNAQIKNITVQRDALLARVRNAEQAADAGMSEASSDSSLGRITLGEIEPEFLATIGTEDVEEAGRADEIRLQLISCYREYNGVKAAIDAMNK